MASIDARRQVQGLGARSASTTGAGSSHFTGTNTGGIADINDHGFQVQSSAMAVPEGRSRFT